MKKCGLGAIIAFIGLIACAGALAASDVANEMKALLEQGRSAEAYEFGRKNADQFGEPVFDFYFGVAATNTGRAGEGVLALERYVANMADDAQGRLELARAYFVLGIDDRARQEFLLVLDINPPPNIRANVERFLDALRSRGGRLPRHRRLHSGSGLRLRQQHQRRRHRGDRRSASSAPTSSSRTTP